MKKILIIALEIIVMVVILTIVNKYNLNTNYIEENINNNLNTSLTIKIEKISNYIY